MDTLKLIPVRTYLAMQALRDREDGQALVEYALILALVSVAAVGVLTTLSGGLSSAFTNISNDI